MTFLNSPQLRFTGVSVEQCEEHQPLFSTDLIQRDTNVEDGGTNYFNVIYCPEWLIDYSLLLHGNRKSIPPVPPSNHNAPFSLVGELLRHVSSCVNSLHKYTE